MALEIIRQLQEIDLKTASINEIEKLFSEGILGHSRPNIDISPEGLFRARIVTGESVEDLPTTKSIWYPNFAEIDKNYHRYNRCSNKGQNFFYSSNFLGTTIKELNPKDNDLVLIGIFHLKNGDIKIRSQFAGIEALRDNPNHKNSLENYQYSSEQDKLIEKFISEKFQERILETEDYKYKTSIAFSNILLKNDGLNCIIYPSVASNLEFVNYAIKPNFVDDFLICKSTYLYRIKRTTTEFELIPEQYGDRIILNNNDPKNSKIEWLENTESDKEKIRKYS